MNRPLKVEYTEFMFVALSQLLLQISKRRVQGMQIAVFSNEIARG